MPWLYHIIGALLGLIGLLWIGQGLGYIGGSFMTGQPEWVRNGAVALLAGLAVALLLRTDPRDPWAAQTAMIGAALVLLSPRYSWYSLLLVPFIVMSGRWEWFGVVLTLSVLALQRDLWAFRSVLLVALVLVLAAGGVAGAALSSADQSATCTDSGGGSGAGYGG
jgi:hypothetical protein